MIRIKPIKLTRREAVTQAGPLMDFRTVLVLAQLDPETLYTAAKVAAGAYDPDREASKYQSLRLSVYEFGKRHHLKKYPDNLDESGQLIDENGKRINRPAMWRGESWQSHINDLLWNQAVDVFDQVMSLEAQRREQQTANCTYWYDLANCQIIAQGETATAHPRIPDAQPAPVVQQADPSPPLAPTPIHLPRPREENKTALVKPASARRCAAFGALAAAALFLFIVLNHWRQPKPPAPKPEAHQGTAEVALFLEQRWRQADTPTYAYLGEPPTWQQHLASWPKGPPPHRNEHGTGAAFSIFSFITRHSRPTESLLERTMW